MRDPHAVPPPLARPPQHTRDAMPVVASSHAVHFYRDDPQLIEAIASFVIEGLAAGDAVIAVLTSGHLGALNETLQQRGVDVYRVVRNGQLIVRDAAATIARLTGSDGELDEQRVRSIVGELIMAARGPAPGRRVRAFGEMVDLLWRAGESGKALVLESCWQRVVDEEGLTLLCGYGLDNFAAGDQTAGFEAVCAAHDRQHVHAEEDQLDATRQRVVAQLAQRTSALEAEVLRRRQAEVVQQELFTLCAAANRADELADVYEPALDAVCSLLAVERAAVLLFDEDGVMRFKAWRGLSDAYRAAVEGHSPWARTAVDPPPIFVPDVSTSGDLAAYRALFERERIGALGFVPLCQGGKLLGKFMIYAAAPRGFTRRDDELAQTIASQVAQAVARSQLLDAERRERERAQAATHDREEILAVVSHDLKNPLGVVTMSADLILEIDLSGAPDAARARRSAELIQRSAGRIARLIDDLGDFASLQGGHFTISPRALAPGELLTSSIELFATLAQARGVAIELQVAPDLPDVHADQHRATQALGNLVANAVKLTRTSGRVVVGAEPADLDGRPAVRLYVDDAGPGLERDELPHIFDRYWRGKNASYRGTGLGLAIAKGITQAHGGRIEVDSTLGVGSRFSIVLPAA
jgi:signal transduction histidine kinase